MSIYYRETPFDFDYQMSSAPSSPKSTKRSAENGAADAGSAAKRAKAEDYQLNTNLALDKEHEGKSFNEIIKLSPSALQGLAGRADKMLAHFRIRTIEDLGKWKYFLIARSIASLAKTEEKGKRHADARSNINKALDKAHEKKSLNAILKEPVSALEGLAEWSDSVLKPLKAGTIAQLAEWKFAVWSESFTTLAQFETADGSS